MIEKRCDLARSQIPGVPLSVEVDEASDPVKIGFLRAEAVVQAANRLPNLLQQARFRRRPRNIVHTASPEKSVCVLDYDCTNALTGLKDDPVSEQNGGLQTDYLSTKKKSTNTS